MRWISLSSTIGCWKLPAGITTISFPNTGALNKATTNNHLCTFTIRSLLIPGCGNQESGCTAFDIGKLMVHQCVRACLGNDELHHRTVTEIGRASCRDRE